VLLFTRPPGEEARVKGLRAAEAVFERVSRGLRDAVAGLSHVDLLVAGSTGPGAGSGPGIRQTGRTFGERLTNAFAEARERGYREVLAVPGDVPGLDGKRLVEAFAALRRARVVLGPSPDGGVYLIGCRGSAGALLREVRWQTGSVFCDLRRGAPDAAVLPPLADLDRRADLGRIEAEEGVHAELRDLIRRIRSSPRPPRPSFEAAPRLPAYAASPETRGPPLSA
jgi:2-phospho-L-lactate guanylyltransferase (CobY/MobA/RfbA family)